MSLYHEKHGTGRDLVLLHGWGMHSGIWSTLVDTLARDYTLTLVDLPGHGRSRVASMGSSEDVARQLLEIAPTRAIWMGWSLGGLLAQKLATMAPQRVQALIVVAALPSFVARDDWAFGINADVFASFAEQLETEFDATLIRFLSLQTRGVAQSKELLRTMRAELTRHGKPDLPALHTGLDILQHEDLRLSLRNTDIPVKFILGERDTFVDAEAGKHYCDGTRFELEIIQGAGHTPFLSHPDEFVVALKHFMKGLTK